MAHVFPMIKLNAIFKHLFDKITLFFAVISVKLKGVADVECKNTFTKIKTQSSLNIMN